MATETFYQGSISSDLRNKQTTDGVLLTSLLQEVDNLIALYRGRQQALLRVMGYRTNTPDADRVLQVKAKWQRFAEHGAGSMRTRMQYDIAVSTAIVGYESYLEWTRFSQILALSATTIRAFVAAIIEENARFRYMHLWQQFFIGKPRTVVDEITKLPVVQNPFYYGSGDTQVPPPVGNKTFSAGHNHYVRTAATANITEADLDAHIRHVAEHGFNRRIFVIGDEATMDEIISIGAPAIAQNYVLSPDIPLDDVNANQPGALMPIAVPFNEIFNIVGVYKGRATLLSSSEIPAGYYGVFSFEGPNSQFNPLQVREPDIPDMRGLQRFQDSQYPFVNNHFEDFVGTGTRQRGNGLAAQWIYTGTNTDPYVAPTWAEDAF